MFTITLNKRRRKSISLGFFNRFVLLSKLIRKETVLIYFVFFFVSILLLSTFNKATLHLKLNEFNSAFFDVFFKYTTFLGDGILFGVLVIVFFFINKRMSLVFATAGVVTLLNTHLFKKIIFSGLPRPAQYFGLENLHLVEGVEMAFSNTFPSGHTTTAFAVFTIFCLYYKNCKSQYLWVLLAIIAGVSRVYLSQHFWLDIFVGSIFGILIGFLSMAFFSKHLKKVH